MVQASLRVIDYDHVGRNIKKQLLDLYDISASNRNAETKILSRIENCGKKIVLQCKNGCNVYREVKTRCKLRICPRCEKYREKMLIRKYIPRVMRMRWPKFVTLTWKEHTFSTERRIIDQANKSFKLFMQTLRRMGKYPLSYLKVIEIVWTPLKGYYYHMHIVWDGPTFVHTKCIKNNEILSDAWFKATKGESYITDFQIVNSIAAVSKYVMCYLTGSNKMKLSYKEYAPLYGVQFFSSKNLPRPIYSLYELIKCVKCGSTFIYINQEDYHLGKQLSLDLQCSKMIFKPPPLIINNEINNNTCSSFSFRSTTSFS